MGLAGSWRMAVAGSVVAVALMAACGSDPVQDSPGPPLPASDSAPVGDTSSFFSVEPRLLTETMAQRAAAAHIFTEFGSLDENELTGSHGFSASLSDLDRIMKERDLQFSGLESANQDARFWVINLIGPAEPSPFELSDPQPTAYYWAMLEESSGKLFGFGREAELPIMLTEELAIAAADDDLDRGMRRN